MHCNRLRSVGLGAGAELRKERDVVRLSGLGLTFCTVSVIYTFLAGIFLWGFSSNKWGDIVPRTCTFLHLFYCFKIEGFRKIVRQSASRCIAPFSFYLGIYANSHENGRFIVFGFIQHKANTYMVVSLHVQLFTFILCKLCLYIDTEVKQKSFTSMKDQLKLYVT